MSLESWPVRADTGDMSYFDGKHDSTGRGFSASLFRQAMGPGYQVAAFTEQPAITGLRPVGSNHQDHHHS